MLNERRRTTTTNLLTARYGTNDRPDTGDNDYGCRKLVVAVTELSLSVSMSVVMMIDVWSDFVKRFRYRSNVCRRVLELTDARLFCYNFASKESAEAGFRRSSSVTRLGDF